MIHTSSFVCKRGIGYWKTQHPTVSGELEIYTKEEEEQNMRGVL